MKKKWMYSFITVFILLLAFVLIQAISIFTLRNCEEPYETGKDTYQFFGNCRFQIVNTLNRKSLDDLGYVLDNRSTYTELVPNVEKYIEEYPFVYLIGEYKNPYESKNYTETTTILYNSNPHYLVLNTESEDIVLYHDYEDIPEETVQFFEKKVNWFCKIQRTCYEAAE